MTELWQIFHGEMQQDPVLSDFVTKMLNASPVIRPRASDLLNHPYVLNPPEVRATYTGSTLI